MKINKIKIGNFFNVLFWLAAGAGCIVLLVSAVRKKDSQKCTGMTITISGVSNNFFIDKNDVYAIIRNHGGDSSKKKSLQLIDLRKIEAELEKDVWIKNAELFFDNNNRLRVAVEEREPLARIFTAGGNSFYIDSSCKRLPLSEKFSARLPVFTNFPSAAINLSKPDSSLLCEIRNISFAIAADSFLNAMIDQVDITFDRGFEMTPKIGKHIIVFGDGKQIEEKFSKLKLFYKEVITKAGWNRYNSIDLQFRNQVVAKIRGKEDIIADSLRTLQLMKFIAEDAARRSADSLQTIVQDTKANTADVSMINQSIQRDEEPGNTQPAAIPESSEAAAGGAAPAPMRPKPKPKPKPRRADLPANDY